MTSILPFAIALVVLLALAVFFWIWWSAPRDQVPPHLTEAELRRLEVQDRLRQTNYQILAALGLGATFLATVFQLAMTSRQWNEDFELKSAQERLTQYADALKAISERGAPATAGIGSLVNLALQDPEGYRSQAHTVLSALVRKEAATTSPMQSSQECGDDHAPQYPRGEADPMVQAAITALGNRALAAYRDKFKFASGTCESWAEDGRDLVTLSFDHRYLDELDLSRRDFSCLGLSQAQLHLVSFYKTILRGADFRGARIADYETPNFPKDEIIKNGLYAEGKRPGQPAWRTYRCLATDFRGADLTGADFGGAAVGGADFSGADLTNANFCGADISRANFTAAKGITNSMFDDACVGTSIDDPFKRTDWDAQPVGLRFLVFRCHAAAACSSAFPPKVQRTPEVAPPVGP